MHFYTRSVTCASLLRCPFCFRDFFNCLYNFFLISYMLLIQDRAQNLPESERREYAEQVAMAFMSAMGQEDADDSELSD